MDITKLIPKNSSFYLLSLDKTLELRPCRIADHLEVEERFGGFGILKDEAKFSDIIKIAFLLLTDESKLNFKAVKSESIDDEGNVVDASIGGVKLFAKSISNTKELASIIDAIRISIGATDEVKKTLQTKKQ